MLTRLHFSNGLNVRCLGDVGDDLLLVGVDLGIGRLGELRLALQSLIKNAASDLPGPRCFEFRLVACSLAAHPR